MFHSIRIALDRTALCCAVVQIQHAFEHHADLRKALLSFKIAWRSGVLPSRGVLYASPACGASCSRARCEWVGGEDHRWMDTATRSNVDL
jgi:hypothetical protein